MKVFASFLLMFLLTFSPQVTAEKYIAFGGYAETDVAVQGSKVLFSASIYNNDTDTGAEIQSMNVTFAIGTQRIKLINASKTYDTDRKQFEINETFTDTILVDINFDPGRYNVSIFFVVIPTGSTALAENKYALANATFTVRGVSTEQEFLQGVLITAIVLAGLFALYVIYNRWKSKL